MHPLNTIQSKMALNHQLTGNTQVVTLLRFNAPLNIAEIKSRLASFRESHIIFNSAISKKAGLFYFSPSHTELPLFVKDGTNPEKLDIALQELAEVIDSTAILWRLRIYCGEKQYFAAYTRHHAISDNVTSSLFLNSIFADFATEAVPVLPVKGAMLPALTEFRARQGAPLLRIRNGQLHYSQHVASADRSTGIAYTLFSPALTAKLAAAAQARSESLNSLLVHHYADAVMRYFQLPEITLCNALSVRDEGDHQLGCFIDVIPITLEKECSKTPSKKYHTAMMAAKNTSLSSTLPTREEVSQLSVAVSAYQRDITDIPLSIAITNNGRFKIRNPEIAEIFNVVNRTGANFPISLHVSFFFIAIADYFHLPTTVYRPCNHPCR